LSFFIFAELYLYPTYFILSLTLKSILFIANVSINLTFNFPLTHLIFNYAIKSTTREANL
jgi:hypothetical protein